MNGTVVLVGKRGANVCAMVVVYESEYDVERVNALIQASSSDVEWSTLPVPEGVRPRVVVDQAMPRREVDDGGNGGEEEVRAGAPRSGEEALV